jgi:hypothetical protein
MNAAREKVRVAHALKDLPQISEAFRRGELSYSKVRAMTRIADASNEDYLLMIARHGTAHHVEKLVSKYRRCQRLQDAENADRQHEKRELYCGFDDDGSMIIRGRLPAEQGALVMKALELAMDRADNLPDDVTAETSGREPFHARRADALAGIAETYLNSEPGDNATADRYQVVLHVTADNVPSGVNIGLGPDGIAGRRGRVAPRRWTARYRGNIPAYCLRRLDRAASRGRGWRAAVHWPQIPDDSARYPARLAGPGRRLPFSGLHTSFVSRWPPHRPLGGRG